MFRKIMLLGYTLIFLTVAGIAAVTSNYSLPSSNNVVAVNK